jgi:predicted dehydrogenase
MIDRGKHRVGIIGCGGIARAHARGYAAAPGARLAALYDVDAGRARAFAGKHGGGACVSLEEMLAEAELDAVSVCTPPAFHEEAACAALRAGVAVCCEKPLAHNAESARRMCACAAETGALLVTAYKFRFFPNVLWAKEMLDAGRLGEVLAARVRFAGIIDMSGTWFSKKEVAGGGVMMDNGAHAVDLLRFLLGEVRAVFAVVANRGAAMEVEDSCRMLLDMASGAWGEAALSWAVPQPANILEVHGTAGLLELSGKGGRFLPARGEPESFAKPDDGLRADPFAAQLGWFLDCIDGRREPRATAGDGLRALEIIEAAYASAAEPGWIAM